MWEIDNLLEGKAYLNWNLIVHLIELSESIFLGTIKAKQ